MTSDIDKSELRGVAFVAAHNAGQLSDERTRLINEFDVATYRAWQKRCQGQFPIGH